MGIAEGQGGSRETSEEVTAIDNSETTGLGGCGGGDKWLDWKYNLKGDPKGCADGLTDKR